MKPHGVVNVGSIVDAVREAGQTAISLGQPLSTSPEVRTLAAAVLICSSL